MMRRDSSENISRATTVTEALSKRAASFNLKKLRDKDRQTKQLEVLQAAKRGAINAAVDFENHMRTERGKVILDVAQRHQDHYSDEVSYLQAAFVIPAREMTNTFSLPRVNATAAIVDVLRTLQDSSVVVVSGWQDVAAAPSAVSNPDPAAVRDKLWNKTHFMERALLHSNFLDPVSVIADQVPEVPCVHISDTLDRVILAMVVSGYDQVGTMNNEDMITGVITYEDVYKCIMDKVDDVIPVEHHAGKGAERESLNARGDMAEEEIEDGGGLRAMTLDEVQSLKDSLKARKEVGRLQKMAQEWVEAAATEILIMLLLLLDVSMTIYGLQTSEDELGTGTNNPLNVVTGIILFVFTFEAIVRIFGYRMSLLNGTRLLETVDVVVVAASIVVYLLTITEAGEKRNKDIVVIARILRFLRLIKIFRRIRKTMNQRRHRYQQDGFDLDLTYVTPTCIAMALPAIGAEANFRNAIDDVIRFFTTKHDKHYLIYNVCAERQYDRGLFDGRVERIETMEHSPPRIDQLVSFVEHVAPHLDADTSNVVAVHCRNGRGRTGVVVCSWLLYSKYSDSAQDAMQVFSSSRMGEKAKVEDVLETPSQRRYVHYMQSIVENNGYRTNRLLLKNITLHTTPAMDRDGGCDPWFMIEENGRLVFDWSKENAIENMDKNRRIWEARDLDLPLAGDVRIVFFDHDTVPVPRDELMFFFFFHTGFVEQESVMFPKDAIDVAASDKKCKIFKEHFKVELQFEMIPTPKTTVSASGKSVLGPWRRVEEPSLRIVEKAKRHRGREQDLAAAGKIFTITVENTQVDGLNLGDDDEVGALLPVSNNLCSADGSPVRHDNVQLISVAGHDIHGHKQAKKLMEQYRKGQIDGGKNTLSAKARALVSGNKRRFQDDGFDLDLTYVTPRMIAMGYPSKGVEGQYRNSETEVYRFFQERHAGHFRVINLVSERAYNLDMFHGAVARYPFPDHNPPAMELLLPCCAHIHGFLQANDDHVVAVHCKAGKGRTGLILICYLLYGGLRRSALSARGFYDSQRTLDNKGLTIISQIRYAHYFEEQLRRIKLGKPCSVSETSSPAMLLRKVRIDTIPHFDRDGGCDPFVGVGVKCEYDLEEHPVFRSRDGSKAVHVKPEDQRWEFRFPDEGVRVAGDTHIAFGTEGAGFLGKASKMCHLWVHTCFMEQPPPEMAGKSRRLNAQECAAEGVPGGTWLLRMEKKEIDMAAQDKKHAKFDESFAVEVLFLPLEGQFGVGPAFEDIKTTLGNKKRVLYLEKEEYERNCQEREMKGNDKLPFEKWLMGAERGCPDLGMKKALSTSYGLSVPNEEDEAEHRLSHMNSGVQDARSPDWADDAGHHAHFLGHAQTVSGSPTAAHRGFEIEQADSPLTALSPGGVHILRKQPPQHEEAPESDGEVERLRQEVAELRRQYAQLKASPPAPAEAKGHVEQLLRTYADQTDQIQQSEDRPQGTVLNSSFAFANVAVQQARQPRNVADVLNAASTQAAAHAAISPPMQLAMAAGSFPSELVCQLTLQRDIVIGRQGSEELAGQLEADFASALQLGQGDVRCLSLTTNIAAALVGIRDRQTSQTERDRLRQLLEDQAADPASPLRSGAVSKAITQARVTPVPLSAAAGVQPVEPQP